MNPAKDNKAFAGVPPATFHSPMARFAPRPGSLLEKEFLMSKKEIDRFNAAVRKNPKWLEEIKKLGTNVDGIIAFAKEKGFKFTRPTSRPE